MILTLNGQSMLSARLVIPYRGAWLADTELDPLLVALAPTSGPGLLTLGTTPLRGTVDPRGSGTFVSKTMARVVAGGGGWDKSVGAQHFANPAGLLTSAQVLALTGALVQEIVADPTPFLYGKDFVRVAGPASSVFGDRDWHVDALGITEVAPWPPALLPDGATITEWDPAQLRGEIATDGAVIWPNTTLIDDRFNGTTYTVRDVEMVLDRTGAKAIVWCADNKVSRLQDALASLVRQYANTAYVQTYLYRFVLPVGGTKLALQGITPNAPDLNPIEQWSGMSGVSAKLLPGTEIVVGFVGGDPSLPYLVSFSPLGVPLEVDLAGGAFPLVPAPWAIGLAAALTTFAAACASSIDPTLVSAAAALNTALSTLPAPATLLTKAT